MKSIQMRLNAIIKKNKIKNNLINLQKNFIIKTN